MSKNLDKVIQRAISDAAFRRQLQTNPQAALRGFKLTDDEVAALRSGDAGKLVSLGIDQRMSKAFTTFGAIAGNVASRASVDGGLSLGGSALADTGGARMGSQIITGNPNARSADFDGGNAAGPAVGDPIQTSQAAASDAIEDQSHAFAASRSADVAGGSVSRVRDLDTPDTTGAVASGQSTTSDALEDQSHAFAASRSADAAGGSVSRVRDLDTPDTTGAVASGQSTTSDALEDQSHAFAGRSDDIEGTVRSAVRDIAPGELQGSGLVAPVEGSPEAFAFQDTSRAADLDAIEDQSHAFSAGRSADINAMGVATDEGQLTANSQPTDATGLSDNVAAAAAGRQGSLGTGGEATFASRVHDTEPTDLRGTTYSGDDAAGPGYLASDDTMGRVSRIRDLDTPDTTGVASGDASGSVSRIRDLDTPDTTAVSSGDASIAASRIRDLDTPDTTGVVASSDASGSSAMMDPDSADAYAPAFHTGGAQGAPSSDALEDMSHSIAANQDAFLSGDEATKYATDPNWSSDQAEDISHSINPDASTTALPEHGAGDAIGNTGTNDPQISA